MGTQKGNTLVGDDPECKEPRSFRRKKINQLSTTELQTMCSEDADAEDPPPNADIGSLMYNGSCSEHTSTDHLVEICYHSDDLHSVQGIEVCVHCIATKKNKTEASSSAKADTEGADEDEAADYDVNEVEFEWKLPETFDDDDVVDHENGTLCIKSIQIRTSGNFTCIASAHEETDEASIMVTVETLPSTIAIIVAVSTVVLAILLSMVYCRWHNTEVEGERRVAAMYKTST